MPDLKSLDNLYLVLVFLVPGLIALFVRSQCSMRCDLNREFVDTSEGLTRPGLGGA